MFAYIEVFYTKFAITATWPQIMQSKWAPHRHLLILKKIEL
jgi:hypothetical protein